MSRASLGIAVIIALCLPNGSFATTNLVQNPGFEDGLSGWNLYESPQLWATSTTNAYEGSQCAEFLPPAPGYYDAAMSSAPFALQGGVTYDLSIAIKDVNTHDTYVNQGTIFDIGLSSASLDGWFPFDNYPAVPTSSSSWQVLTGTYTPTESTDFVLEVQVHGYATASPAYAEVDAVSLTPEAGSTGSGPVPEPLTMTAIGMGIAGLGGYIRRRLRGSEVIPATSINGRLPAGRPFSCACSG